MDRSDAEASPTKSIKSAHTNTDDESITTSTESEAYDGAWTLVTDKNRQRVKIAKEANEKETDGGFDNKKSISEITESEDEGDEADEELQEHNNLALHEQTADDELSDGISIISESESAGRISPHSLIGEQLSNLNLKITLGEECYTSAPRAKLNFPIIQSSANNTIERLEDVVDSSQLLQGRPRKRSSRRNSSKEKESDDQKALKRVDVLAQISEMPPIIRHGLSGLFYVSVAVVALALVGKYRMLVWEPLTGQQSAQNLEQKMIDLDLQNNLMRAEIDLLNKRVNYLSNLKDQKSKSSKEFGTPAQYQQQKYNDKRKDSRTFKAWSGNGNNIEPVDISKGDLKRPYKCSDGKFVEIAGMCVENAAFNEHEDIVHIVDPVSNMVNDILEKSETLKNFAKVAEEVNVFVENPFEAINNKLAEPNKQTPPMPQSQSSPQQQQNQHDRQKQWQQKSNIQHGEARYQKGLKKPNYSKENFGENVNDREQNTLHKEYRQNNDNSNERVNGKRRNNSKERSTNFDHIDKSKQRFRQSATGNSKERKDNGKPRYPAHISKERYDSKPNRPKSNSAERNKDGHWHEHMMQQREYARRQRNDHERDPNNWYIERGDNREQMRYQ